MTGPDRFLGMDGEELIPLLNGYYLAKIEGKFVRYKQIDDHWEAHTKSGTKLEFGLTDLGRIVDTTGTKIYRWCLQRKTDTNGNVIEYGYTRPVESDRQVYLNEVRYGPSAPPWDHSYRVEISYEDRPDSWTDYRGGFKVRTSKRVNQLDTYFDKVLIHRYSVEYGASGDWSLLTTITRKGDDAVSALPSTTFGYSSLNLPDPKTPISAISQTITSSNNLFAAMDNAKADLVDINMDALPDLLFTDAGHIVYLNRGTVEIALGEFQIQWEGPISMSADQQQTLNIDLSSTNVHLADMTGDGVSDLVVTESQWVEYFQNTGNSNWGTGQLMSVKKSPPPAPFGVGSDSIKMSDLDFDKRIDIIKSDFGIYSIWFNLGDGSYSDEILVDGAFYNSQFVDFSDPGVSLADMNGDRLNDIVKITPISVVYFPNMGYGRFDQAVEMFLPDRVLNDAVNGNLHRAKTTDINGDGLADLVVERADGNNMWFFLNMSDGMFASSRVITDLPSTPSSVIRWADINGNGTTDIVFADSSLQGSKINAVDLGVLIAGTPHLNALTTIDNGYGRITEIQYRSSTEYYLDSVSVNHPWEQTLPIPVSVVSKTITSINLDLDGYPDEGPNGDQYITDFVYRNGYYDPIEKQFRGFSFVKKIDRGDERFGGNLAPTLITRHGFHTGAPDGDDNDNDGVTDEFHPWDGREEEPLKGMELWRETTSLPDDPTQDGQFASHTIVFEHVDSTWVIHHISTDAAGSLPALLNDQYRTNDNYQRVVRQAVRTQINTTVMERQTDTLTHKHLETRSDLDPLGNTLFDWNLGDASNPNDDIYTGYEYAMNDSAWIVGHSSRTIQKEGGPQGAFVSDVRNYYDGDPYVGLPLGQTGTRGNLHRTESLISDGSVPVLTERSYLIGDPRDPAGKINPLRQQFDTFGNPVVILGARASLTSEGIPDGNGHERRITYDPLLHKFPTRELVVIGDGKPDLVVDATYHFGFSTPISVSDFNGNISNYTYDTFGRLQSEILPGDDPLVPTKRYEYDWGSPISRTTTITHTKEGDSPDFNTSNFMDGLGRDLGTFEVGGPVMNNVTLYNPRGQVWKVYQPYFGNPLDQNQQWLLPQNSMPATTTRYDAATRVLESITPDDENGLQSHATSQYLPLIVIQHDGEDNTKESPHANTPKTLMYDGLDRLIEVHETESISQEDSGTFITKYRYALPDLLAEIEDSKGNIKYMRYDGLGRELFMNDCDRGTMVYTYDHASNLIHRVDAKQQQIQYSYDGVNRIRTEDYLDSGNLLSFERSPDVIFHYDQTSNDYPGLPNTKGKLSWVEDQAGEEFHGYDARGRSQINMKRIAQLAGTYQDFSTVTLADSLGRNYQIIYPDGSVIRQQYDTRGLLKTIPNFVEHITYKASAQKEIFSLSNGVDTTFSYDPRLRLTNIQTNSQKETLQHLSYDFDQVSNLIGITDGRALAMNDPRIQTASFILDNCYRLQQTIGEGYGTIQYDYDRLGNMVNKTSPDMVNVHVNIGAIISGGLQGTTNRIGRSTGDSPGPHALTSTDYQSNQLIFNYDDNGNIIQQNDVQYLYDFEDRLGKVIQKGKDIRYLYDHTDRRVIKRVDGVQTTYINKYSEVRDGKFIKYVFADLERVARIEGDIPTPATITQRIMLTRGWNLFSFQVVPETSIPFQLLEEINEKYAGVFGYDGNEYQYYIPWFDAVQTLTELLPNHGYWIYVNEPAELIIEGSLSESDVIIPQDNLVLIGLPGLAMQTTDQLLTKTPSIEKIATYLGDELGWRTYNAGDPNFVNNLSATMTGRGYWMMSGSTTLSVSAPTEFGEFFYYHENHLGSTNVVTDNFGALVSETVYYPFGTPRHEFLVDPSFDPTYRFGDKERDRESGLYYFEARYMNSHLGRFINADKFLDGASVEEKLAVLSSPQHLHGYAYTRNNPLSRIDPTGEVDWPTAGWGFVKMLGGAVGAVAGGALLTVSMGGEFVSAGVATPVAVPGMVLGSAGMMGGIGTAVGGFTEMVAGFSSDPGSPQIKAAKEASKAVGVFTSATGTGTFFISSAAGNNSTTALDHGDAGAAIEGLVLVVVNPTKGVPKLPDSFITTPGKISGYYGTYGAGKNIYDRVKGPDVTSSRSTSSIPKSSSDAKIEAVVNSYLYPANDDSQGMCMLPDDE